MGISEEIPDWTRQEDERSLEYHRSNNCKIDSIIKRELEEERGGGEEGGGVDLITSYMKNNKAKNDDKVLRDTLLNFMVAGRDTLSSILSWFFFCLSKNPIIIEKVREELKTTLPPNEARDEWRIFSIEET